MKARVIKHCDMQVFVGPCQKGNALRVFELTGELDSASYLALCEKSPSFDSAFYFYSVQGAHQVRWFSKKASIEFCGHGALGLAHFLKVQLFAFPVEVSSPSEKIQLIAINGSMFAEYSASRLPIDHNALGVRVASRAVLALGPDECTRFAKLLDLRDVRKCWQSQSGEVLLLQTEDPQEVPRYLPNENRILSLVQTDRIHAVLIWTLLSEGQVAFRYFLPHYGKLEDQATGSALRYLASILPANRPFEILQNSLSGGRLLMLSTPSQVLISGEVRIVTKPITSDQT